MAKPSTYRPREITDELKAIAPMLAEGFQRHPWSLPTGYFNQLEQQVRNRITVKHQVPEGYFEQLPDQVMARIRASEQAQAIPSTNTPSANRTAEAQPVRPQAKVFVLSPQLRWAAAAAIVAIISLALIRLLNTPESNTPNATLSTTPDEAIANYVMENIDQWNTEELAKHADISDITLIDSTATQNLEEYLIQDTDISELEDLL